MPSRSRNAVVASLAFALAAAFASTPGEAEDGFFRPANDPSLTRTPPEPGIQPRPVTSAEAVAAAELQANAAREAAERDLDRAAREHREAQASAPVVRPMIVSPLDGTAPIVSFQDGTAPLISPLGR